MRMERDAVITKLSKPSRVILLASLGFQVGYCKSEETRKEAQGSAVAVAAFTEETKGPTSLTPEEAEKLICTEVTCRPAGAGSLRTGGS
jgi:hypothetical protein